MSAKPTDGATDNRPPARGEDESAEKLYRYIRAFIVPTLFLKALILYFGINYSNDPGSGYGWGLVISIVLSLINFAVFIYLNWQETEEDQ